MSKQKQLIIVAVVLVFLISYYSFDIKADYYQYVATMDYIQSGKISYGPWGTIASHRNETSCSVSWEIDITLKSTWEWSITQTELDYLGGSYNKSETEYFPESYSTVVPPRIVAYLKKRTNKQTDVYNYEKYRQLINNYGEIVSTELVSTKKAYETYTFQDCDFFFSNL